MKNEIPEDVMKTAEQVFKDLWSGPFGEEASYIARAIMAERELHQWKPIKSLEPEDGTIVIGWGEYRERDGFSPAFMRWYDSVGGWNVNAMPFFPTHWRPLLDGPVTP
ncbi:hypothetical protein ACQZ46_02520 [Agrobacterium salinitolerans]